jgi:tetrahydromethanopterin S-methyltransferase subunit B
LFIAFCKKDFKQEGFMKNLNFKTKTITVIAISFISLSIGSFFASNHFSKMAKSESALSSGAGTCFQRVTQSFTALMIQDFNSGYLTRPFMDTTGECFSEVNSQFAGIYAKSFKEGFKHINSIVSDLHWFHEKVEKLMKMSQDAGISLNNSNIINKYAALETLKNDFQESVEASANSTNTTSGVWMGLNIFSLIGLVLTATVFGLQRKADRDALSKIEVESNNILESGEQIISAQFERIIENVMAKVDMPNTYSLLNAYHSNLLEKQYKAFDSKDGVDIEGIREVASEVITLQESETADFHNAMSSVIENISEKAFTHGIIIDSELEDEFVVKGEQDALEQLLFSLMSYATESSLHQIEGRRISLKSKPLGGTAFFKLNMSNYCFNANELNFLNGDEELASSINMNLHLIKEVVKDLGANMAVKNKMNADQNIEGSEIEIIFERVNVEKEVQPKNISIVKGTKKDILKAMQSNA